MNRKNMKGVTVLFVLSIFVLLFLVNIQSLTIIYVSPIFVDPQGGTVVGGEYKGAYWNIVATVNKLDQLSGVITLPEGEDGVITWEGVQKAIETGAKVEIKITPKQAYLLRALTEKTVTVTPQVGQTYVHRLSITDRGETWPYADPLYLNYYDWGEPSFRIYSSYTVEVFKDGKRVGQTFFNTEGSSTGATIPTSEGPVTIENLGYLSGNYLSPNVPSQMCMYPAHVYDWVQIDDLVEWDSGASYTTYYNFPGLSTVTGATDTFGVYWYGGGWRWTNTYPKHPAGIQSFGTNPYNMISTTYGGWQDASDANYLKRNPVTPSVDHLSSFLTMKGKTNLANTIFSSYEKSEVVTEGTHLSLKLTIPWNAYGSPVVNIRVPTDLADTWVEQPQVSEVVPTAYWQSNGLKHLDVLNNAVLEVSLKQNSQVESSTQVKVTCDHNRVGIIPVETTETLAPNEVKTITFQINNLGTEDQIDNIPITVTCYETYTYQPTGSDTVTVTLLPNIEQGNTFLNVKALEKGTTIPVEGLQIQAVFSGQTKTGFTDSQGNLLLHLQTLSGGAVTGNVEVQSVETDIYNSTSTLIFVPEPGVYDVTLHVPVKGVEYTDDYWLWIALAVAVGLVGSYSLGYLTFKKKRRTHQ